METFFVYVCGDVICDCVFCGVVFNYSTPGERRRRNVYHIFCSTVLNVASQGLAVFSQLARNVTLCRPSLLVLSFYVAASPPPRHKAFASEVGAMRDRQSVEKTMGY